MSEQPQIPLSKVLVHDMSDPETGTTPVLAFQYEMVFELPEKVFRAALRVPPNRARTLNNYGSMLFGQRRYQEVSGLSGKALADNLYPEPSWTYGSLGVVSLKLS